jgi:hypothetical protein
MLFSGQGNRVKAFPHVMAGAPVSWQGLAP